MWRWRVGEEVFPLLLCHVEVLCPPGPGVAQFAQLLLVSSPWGGSLRPRTHAAPNQKPLGLTSLNNYRVNQVSLRGVQTGGFPTPAATLLLTVSSLHSTL